MTTSELFPGPPPFFRQYDPSLQHEGQQQPPAPPAPPAQTTYQIFRQQYEVACGFFFFWFFLVFFGGPVLIQHGKAAGAEPLADGFRCPAAVRG